jgi:polyhydroxyalkanoate synthase subunit PhaE
VHTRLVIVEHDPWRQWQELAASFGTAAGQAQPHAAFAAASDLARFTRSAERFAAAARAYFSGADHPSAGTAGTAEERTRNFSDCLRDLFADFPLRFAPDLGAGVGPQAAQRGAWDAPALGATREHQQRWQRMSEAWASIDDAQHRLQRLWSDALRDAAAAFTARLVQTPSIDMSAESMRKLYDGWIDCAEDAYGRMAHGEPFCSALADFMNASSRWRREAQSSMEYVAKLLDLPTRSEINSLMRRLKTLEDDRLRDSANAATPNAAPEKIAAERTAARPRSSRRKAKHEQR